MIQGLENIVGGRKRLGDTNINIREPGSLNGRIPAKNVAA
jgi:hypothetical protein